MKFLKRTIAIMMSVFMLLTSVPFAFGADGQAEVQAEDFTLMSTDSVSRVLANALQGESEDDSNSIQIEDLILEGQTATLRLKTDTSATAVVAVYDESGLQMQASGIGYVEAGTETVTVTIETDSMPQYYTAKAFLLDENNRALCEPFESKAGTRAYAEFLAKTTEDFDNTLVVNLDEAADTNFAVMTEGTVTVSAQEQVNMLETSDSETLTYVFSNIDDGIRSLKVGDTFCYESDEAAIALKVASVKINGNKATIQGKPDAEISEIFDYVKIESETMPDSNIMEQMTLGEGVTYLGEAASGSAKKAPKKAAGAEAEISDSITKKYEMSFTWGNLSGGISVGMVLDFRIYYDAVLFGKDYVEAKAIASTSADANVHFAASFSQSPTLFEGPIPIGTTGILVDVKVSLSVSASAVFDASMHLGAKFGYEYKTGSGLQKVNEKSGSLTPTVKGSIEASVGLNLSIGASFLEVVGVALSGGVAVKAHGDLTIPKLENNSDIQHDCASCVEGTINLNLTGSFSLNLLVWKPVDYSISHDIKLSDFYFSVGRMELGLTKCPHKKYLVTFKAVDENGSPMRGVQIEGLSTDSNGTAKAYLLSGDYTYTVSSGKYPTKFVEFTVNDAAVTQVIDVSAEGDNTAIVASGSCGPSIQYILHSDGTLLLRGTGVTYDYESSCFGGYSWFNSIKKVVIESGITRIGKRLFSGYNNIISVSLPNSLTSIGREAFSGCSKLKQIVFPYGLETIEYRAFGVCNSLQSISIPDTVTRIGESALSETAYFRDEANQEHGAVYCGKYLLRGAKEVERYSIKEGTIALADNAFIYSPNLTYVTIPDSVLRIPERAFYGCNTLQQVVVGNGIQEIASSAFADCINLKRISIGSNVQAIGDSAFSGCPNLSSITLPPALTNIAKNAFNNTAWYNNQPYGACYIGTTLVTCKADNNQTKYVDIEVKEGTKTIVASAFTTVVYLRSVKLPESVTKIGASAFFDRRYLTSVILPDGLQEIPSDCFNGCAKLESINIPSLCSKIGNSAFNGCTSLQTTILPDGIEYIGSSAFYNCPGIVNIPTALEEFGNTAFYNCSGLTDIIIPNGVLYIPQGAFYDCKNLTSVSVSASVEQIYQQAFYGCDSLKTVYIYNSNCGLSVLPYGYSSSVYLPIPYGTTIYGYTNSSAQVFATIYKLPFVALDSDSGPAKAPTRGSAINTYTKTYTHAVKGEQYVLIVVKDKDAQPQLTADNLLYIDQMTAGSESIAFNYLPRETLVSAEALVFGPCNHNYVTQAITEPTCSKAGERMYLCEYCADLQTEWLPALGHTAPNVDGKCERCGRTVSQTDHTFGDVNGDNEVNNKDMNRLMKKLAGEDVEVVEEALDLNGDGNVNNKDLNRLMKYLAGEDVEIY